jgi:hypothetical protein
MLTEITSLPILADSLKMRRIIWYGGTELENWTGKGACLIGEVAGCVTAFKRSLLWSSFVMCWALEYDQLSVWIKALLGRCVSTLIVCDPSNLHIAFRSDLMERCCNRVVMLLDPLHCMKNGFCLHTCMTFTIYFNVSILRDLFSHLIPPRRERHWEPTASQTVK